VLPQFRARDRAQALFILATLKGYFTNFYPALLHCDKDRYIETWALVRCPRPFQTQGARQAVMQPIRRGEGRQEIANEAWEHVCLV